MLNIGKLYLQHTDGQVRLCADIALNGRGTTLWFGVDEKQADYLCHDRSDAFVMALLPTAMRTGQDIVCQTPMSERLHYQLEQLLIPSVCAAGTLYHPIHIQAPLMAEKVNSKGAVATGFSGGVDSLHTIMTHGKDSAYPLTHLTLFNLGVFEGAAYRQGFLKSDRWSNGGTWGNYWGDSGSIAAETPKEFIEFDELLEKLCPNITFLQYKRVRELCVTCESDYENDYYSGREEYSYWVCDLKQLHNALAERNLI